MSLYLALLWVICAAICLGVFGFCRKRIADIAQQVSEEIGHQCHKIIQAEHDAESRLVDTFCAFANPAEAIADYQKSQEEIFQSPQAKPPWNWSREDLELWRKHAISRQKAHRSRSIILTAVLLILALNIAALVITVITLNHAKPVIGAPPPSVSAGGTAAGNLPLPVLPVQSPPVSMPPPLPAPTQPILPDSNLNDRIPPNPDLDTSVPARGPSTNDPNHPGTGNHNHSNNWNMDFNNGKRQSSAEKDNHAGQAESDINLKISVAKTIHDLIGL